MRAIAAGFLALGLLLSGCGGDPAPESAPPSSGGTSDSPSADPSADVESSSPSAGTSTAPARGPAPVPAPPPATNDRAGRDAFARYVLQSWIFALNTNDPRPLLEISGDRPCAGCQQLADELEERAEDGWYVALDDVRVSTVDVTAAGRTARAVMSVSIPESSTFHEDGTFRSSNPAHPRSYFEVEMTHEGQRFRLTSFSLY